MTEQEKMEFVEGALKNAAEYHSCEVTDLEWKFDVHGALHVRKKNERTGDKVSG